MIGDVAWLPCCAYFSGKTRISLTRSWLRQQEFAASSQPRHGDMTLAWLRAKSRRRLAAVASAGIAALASVIPSGNAETLANFLGNDAISADVSGPISSGLAGNIAVVFNNQAVNAPAI